MATIPNQFRPSDMAILASSTRMGSFALLLFATVALMAGALLDVPLVSQSRILGIRRLWIMSQILFAGCLFATAFVSTAGGLCVLTGLCGISWAVTIWAPFAVISSQVSLSKGHEGDEEEEYDEFNNEDCERRPGVAFGIHNAAIFAPQILAAAGCSIIFRLTQASSPGDGVSWALRAGGLAALGAAVLAAGID